MTASDETFRDEVNIVKCCNIKDIKSKLIKGKYAAVGSALKE